MRKQTFTYDENAFGRGFVIKSISACAFGLLCIGAISASGWWMSYSTAASSLETAGFGYMANIPLYLSVSLMDRVDPIRFHLIAGLSMIHAKQINVTDWGGIHKLKDYTTPFLANFFKDSKCCFTVAINTGLDKRDVDAVGGWKEWFDMHPLDWGDDRMVADVVLLDKDSSGQTTFTEYRTNDTTGSRFNNWVAYPLDTLTYEPLVPMSEASNLGFRRFNWIDISWKTVHMYNMQPGEFKFTPIIVWNFTKPNTLKSHGIVALYENTRPPNSTELAQFQNGNPPYEAGRRVGVWIVGFKLGFLSLHLASMDIKGGFVYLIDRSSGVFVASSDTSVESLAEDERGERTIPVMPGMAAHPLIRLSAQHICPTGDWSLVTSGHSFVRLDGVDYFLLVFEFDYHGLSFVGVYLVKRAIVLKDLDDKATNDAALSIVINTAGSAILLTCFAFAAFRNFQKFRAATREHKRQIHMKLQDGIAAAYELAYPMTLLNGEDFAAISPEQLVTCYEGLRNLGMLRVLDTTQQVYNFKSASNVIVLYSYEWQSWTKLGPDAAQLKWMKGMLPHIAAFYGVPLARVHVWLDIISVPQCHPAMKAMAINSICVYALLADALVVVAPATVHESTGIQATRETYRSRVWTRLEQVMMYAANGLESMYFATDEGLEPMTMEWLKDSFDIFGSNVTCCRLQHTKTLGCDKENLVLPLLGLWFRLLASQRGILRSESADRFFEIVSRDMNKYFPKHFVYSQAGKVPFVKRELFGNLIESVTSIANAMSDAELNAMFNDSNCARKAFSEPKSPVPSRNKTNSSFGE